ncbi:MAG: hypothetical protein ACTS46_01650 [Candidatus Hodgkinia cicadicola]
MKAYHFESNMNWLTAAVTSLGDISKSRFAAGSSVQVRTSFETKFNGTCSKLKQKSPWVSCHVKSLFGGCVVEKCFDRSTATVQIVK